MSDSFQSLLDRHKLLPLFFVLSLSLAQNCLADTVYHADASVLSINGVRAAVEITVAKTTGIEVRIDGVDQADAKIAVDRRSDVVSITQRAVHATPDIGVIVIGEGNASISMVTIGDRTTVVHGSNLIETGKGSHPIPVISVKAPVGAVIDITDVSGPVNIGDTLGRLVVKGRARMNVGAVDSALIDIDGNSRIRIDKIRDGAEVSASGNTRVDIDAGRVSRLTAVISDNARLRFGGHAEQVDLRVTDNGRLSVASAEKRLRATASRNGRLKIGNQSTQNKATEE